MIDARGPSLLSNEKSWQAGTVRPARVFVFTRRVPSASVYVLDKKSLDAVTEAARRLPPVAQGVHPSLLEPQASRRAMSFAMST